MNEVIAAAIFSIGGVVIGASMQHFFSRQMEMDKALRADRRAAYSDWLDALTKSAFRGQSKDVLVQATHAKNRIALYGSPSVIRALAEFEKLGASLESGQQRKEFTTLIEEMRKDGMDRYDSVPPESIQLILLGNTQPNQAEHTER